MSNRVGEEGVKTPMKSAKRGGSVERMTLFTVTKGLRFTPRSSLTARTPYLTLDPALLPGSTYMQQILNRSTRTCQAPTVRIST
jgi:hypothetical protein